MAHLHELSHFVLVVDDENAHAEGQGRADIAVPLDRVRMNTAVRRDPRAPHHIDFPVARQVEVGALREQRFDDRLVRQWLQCVM